MATTGVSRRTGLNVNNELKKVKELTGGYNDLTKSLNKTSESASKLADNFGKMTSASTMYSLKTLSQGVLKIVSSIGKLSQKSVDYIEDLNLLKVAFGDTADEAYRLVKNIANVTGFDEATLTRNLATFRNLTSTLGMANEEADLLATNLEKMSLDISSLYNVDLDRASYALQGMLTGQPRTIKTLTGANVTNASLQEELTSRGIGLKVSELNKAQKAILQYVTVEKQLINSNGDLARTIEQPAQLLRVFREQVQRAARDIGSLFIPVIKAIIPYLTAFLMVISEVIEVITRFFGIDTESFWKSMDYGTTKVQSNFDGIASSVKKANLGLRAFDKLNVISTPSSGSGGGAGIGDMGIGKEFEDMLKEYNLKLDQIKTKATTIRDNIMEWLGFSKEIDETTGEVSWKFEKITGGTILGALITGGAIFLGIKSIFKILSKLTGLKFTGLAGLFGKNGTLATGLKSIMSFLGGINPVILLIAAAIAAVVAIAVKLYKENDEFREKVNKFFETIKTTFGPFIKSFIESLKTYLKSLWEVLKQLYENVIKPLVDLLAKILKPVLEVIIDILTALMEHIIKPLQPVFEWLINTALKIVISLLEGLVKHISNIIKVLTWLWDNILGPLYNFIVEGIKSYIIPAIETIGTVIDKIKKAIQKIVDWWNGLSFNKKNISVEYETKGGGGSGSSGSGGKITSRASGGFIDTGQYFLAREAGPELVGRIGHRTAVANNDQIVNAVAQGVANAIISTGGMNSRPVIIKASGDANGLMNFIKFKQQEDNMQYGN